MPVIGITGASGKLGRLTTQYVLATHPADDLILFSRSPGSLGEFADRGAAARHADFDMPELLVEAFCGVDVLLMISTNTIERRQKQQAFAIAAAAAAGVGRIVYTSMPNPHREFPAALQLLGESHAATEEMLRGAGPSWTLLRNALYSEAFVPGWIQAGSTGELVTNRGSGRHAPISRDDCAAAAAAALVGDGHEDTVYDIAGQRLLDDAAVAAAIAARYDRSVEVVQMSDDEYAASLAATGLPAAAVSALTAFGTSIRTGLLETPIGDTERLIGRSPVAIEESLETGVAGS